MPATHEVINQVPTLVNHDLADDPALLEGLRREGAADAEPELRALGTLAGSEQAQEWGRLAHAYPPILRTHDRYGHRIDEVEFNPVWHQLMEVAVSHGIHGTPWRDGNPGAHVARAAKMYVWGQVEPGHDYGLRVPTTKRGLIAGMSMTEKQGGSDVRANTTRAVPSDGETYLLTGHKWFTSAPMSDMFLTLAQAPGGLSCFLIPRVLPDGTRNNFFLQRLKDKLGNRSNASAEVEYEDTVGWLVGEEGRGVRTIIEMVNMTRLDCVLGSAAGMRHGVAQASHHAAHRMAFGRYLVEAP